VRYLLDTNVLSEIRTAKPDARVVAWLRQRSVLDVAISVMSVGEIQHGVSLLPASARRSAIDRWLTADLPTQFSGRILPIDMDVAREWGRLSADGLRRGRKLAVVDGLLLATAAVHGLTLATRNTQHCAGRGVDVVDPWVDA
jgi:predicted nucleic acid-binding protein